MLCFSLARCWWIFSWFPSSFVWFIPFVSHTTFCFMFQFHGAIVRLTNTHTSHHSKFITNERFVDSLIVVVVVDGVVAVVVYFSFVQWYTQTDPHSTRVKRAKNRLTEMHFSTSTHSNMCVLDCAAKDYRNRR